ncbi:MULTISPECIES: SDR family NAD(P)-dependent oxidoreductase [unclassified Roseitalea]|uniref:SDR family NAD(P)-dependent oxidoreductase n=1 Tax=unclassified Roseitalea TaxID=2639107 RepID=UPI00273EF065|nr:MULTISPECIES: SDR family NAD(P)-dependent oxidoreductase [unclassified Roseitalea]
MTSKRSIIVTGCSSGIGAHCARRLRADGWHVFASARKRADLERLVEGGFDAHYLDYREPDSIDSFFEQAIEACDGRLDALFNNGGYSQPGAVEDVPAQALREQLEANVIGWHQLARHCVQVMRRQGHGRIVNNSSVLALVPVPLRGVYTASKWALEGLMLTMRQELAGSGIAVSQLDTGPVPSRIAVNAIAYVDKYIDVEGSVHAADYRRRLAELRAGGTGEDGGRRLDAVYRALARALNDAAPRAHYLITSQTRAAALGKRLLPWDTLYRLLARAA